METPSSAIITEGELISLEHLNATTYQVKMKLQTSTVFSAGQYLELILQEKGYPFSIASHYNEEQIIELHIGVSSNNSASQSIIQHFQSGNTTKIKIPLGQCTFPTASAKENTILIAAATGFAQAKSIIGKFIEAKHNTSLHLYWGCRQLKDFYLLEDLERLSKEYPNFHCNLVVSDNMNPEQKTPYESLPIQYGLVHNIALKDFPNFDQCQVFLSGSQNMVISAAKDLKQHGLEMVHCHSDMFEFIDKPI